MGVGAGIGMGVGAGVDGRADGGAEAVGGGDSVGAGDGGGGQSPSETTVVPAHSARHQCKYVTPSDPHTGS